MMLNAMMSISPKAINTFDIKINGATKATTVKI